MWKYFVSVAQVLFKYRRITTEIKHVYQKYLEAREDGKITVKEMKAITDEVFDVVGLFIPAIKELKSATN